MHHLKSHLIRMAHLCSCLLQGEQFIGPEIALVIAGGSPRKDGRTHVAHETTSFTGASTISPSRMCTTRSPKPAASGLWVIMSTVWPNSLFDWRNMESTTSEFLVSRFPVGS